MKLNIKQNTPEWEEWRKELAGSASEAAIIMDCAPTWWDVSTKKMLREIKAGIRKRPPPTAATQAAWDYGHAMEGPAREAANKYLGMDFEPACFEITSYGLRLGASLDGLDYEDDMKYGLEIKCPMTGDTSRTWRDASQLEELLPHYYWQIIHQMAVADLDKVFFFVYLDDGRFYCSHVSKDTEAEDELWAAWREFNASLPVERTDDAWKMAASEYSYEKAQMAAHKQRMEEAKKKMVGMAAGQDTYGSGSILTHSKRRGSLSAASLLQLSGMSDEVAESARGAPTDVVTVSGY